MLHTKYHKAKFYHVWPNFHFLLFKNKNLTHAHIYIYIHLYIKATVLQTLPPPDNSLSEIGKVFKFCFINLTVRYDISINLI